MKNLDQRLKEMATRERLAVPEQLHRRIENILETPKSRRMPMGKLPLLAAVIAVLGMVTVGASFHLTHEDMGFYIRPEPSEQPVPDSAEQVTQVWKTETVDSESVGSDKFAGIPVMSEEEIQVQVDQYETYTALYEDPQRREAAMQAAEALYDQYELWDAEVTGARYEHIQYGSSYDCAEVLVVLYLSDGCGYRMIMDAETLELNEAVDLLPEVMEDEYFKALWDGTVEAYHEKMREHAVG